MNSENCHLCYQPVTTENYLFPVHTDHYASRKEEQPLQQHFKFQTQYSEILTVIVQHSILILLHLYLKLQVCLTDLSQSAIQILYGL